MASNYKKSFNVSSDIHFSRALFGEAERSRMTADPILITTMNAGDIVPVYCREILPEQDLSIDMDFILRQTTLLTPTMGNMVVDYFAFWVPNRIVNQSWKAVEGENLSGSWTADEVSLATLKVNTTGSTQIPVGSVADYYDFPTQMPIPNSVLAQCHDLKFRGYVMIYNEHFRDQNYQPPIPMSTLNVYQGFLDSNDSPVPFDGQSSELSVPSQTIPDGSFGAGAISQALYGSGRPDFSTAGQTSIKAASADFGPTGSYGQRFRAINKPLKANKLHDYFTSVLPSPQKSPGSVLVPVSGEIDSIPVRSRSFVTVTGGSPALTWMTTSGTPVNSAVGLVADGAGDTRGVATSGSYMNYLTPNNLSTVSTDVSGLSIDISDLRMASAIQQIYEVLARGGSRYRSILSSFFGVEYDEAFCDVPVLLGKISRNLDLFQSAQTSASSDGSTPQGNLAGFGYTNSSGKLFSHHFVEHGYLHVFAVVRHRNIYSSYLPRDNFRLSMLDFYLPQMANISEQPVYTREINPFAPNPDDGFGFQEAHAEYRFEPDRVTGLMRTMPEGVESLSLWNYADDFDYSLQISNGTWLKSNSERVLNRSLAVTSDHGPQFKLMIHFHVDKELPMPTYSVGGMDII